ncbi:hypothetical protein VTJ04DRAFT_6665 [Mycothermus thermophilus]|uniref:uncharacterized protein n=1 Tax=Humicola insolens TaxID=85995 RepID=UPI00374425B9
MRTGVSSSSSSSYNSGLSLLLFSATSSWPLLCLAAPWSTFLPRRSPILDSRSPSPEGGSTLSASATRDTSILPAQIGGIVGAYGISLVIVSLILIALSKRRREHLRNRDKPPEQDNVYFGFNPFPQPFLLQSEEEYKKALEEFQKLQPQLPPNGGSNGPAFPYQQPLTPRFPGPLSLNPLSPTKSQHSVAAAQSPTSTILAAGIDLSVDQNVVSRDRAMAQQQLEEMYRHVMEAEQAKLEGREYQPPIASPSQRSLHTSPSKSALKKEKNKPSSLNLSRGDDRPQSRSSSMFSFLKSPRRKQSSGAMNISSPILTPMSGTFPRQPEAQELAPMSPRHYYPAPLPPPSATESTFRRAGGPASPTGTTHNRMPTPDISPVSTQSIDSRIDAAIGNPPPGRRREQREQRERDARGSLDDRGRYYTSHSRDASSTAPSVAGDAYTHEPPSAVSERSTTHLVGLPSSPRAGVTRFPSVSVDSLPSLPASPRPGQTSFQFPVVDPRNLPREERREKERERESDGENNKESGGSGAQTPAAANNANTNANASTTSLRTGTGAPSAVREGGVLPFRAFEPPTSPSFQTTTVKQTVFTRGPLSPGGGPMTGGLRSPWTGAPVPYTPYQPFSPLVPITPTVVTKADRKRMKRMEPKTPTVEMVKSIEEVW